MKKQPWCNFVLAGLSLTDFGLEIPSPFTSLELSNSEITSMTSWTLQVVIGGSDTRGANTSSFEALLYSAAQESYAYNNASGIPVSFAFGWLDETGQVESYVSYQGFTLQFSVSTSGIYLVYKVTGYASLAEEASVPVINIPEVCGWVQPSALAEGFLKGFKANTYYELDIDHNDEPTFVNHGYLTTSQNKYIRGTYSGQDDYDAFPGCIPLSKSYNSTREASGVKYPYTLGAVVDSTSNVSSFLTPSITDNSIQCVNFSYWVDEPTQTQPGVIHYKSNANLNLQNTSDILKHGVADTNILTLSGSYNGVSYNISNMNFKNVGFTLDATGDQIVNNAQVVNSWSASLSNVFQTANIINDVNALATQFSGDFTIEIPGNVKHYKIAQPVSLIVYNGNTLSPITGIYNIISVGHKISNTFVTTLKVQRLQTSAANEVASSRGILVNSSSNYSNHTKTTANIKSTCKVDFGETIYPTMPDLRSTENSNVF